MGKNAPLATIAGANGTKIFTGVGPHTVNAYTFVCRVQDTVILSAKTTGDVAITLTNHMPAGTKLNVNEFFSFPLFVKTITLTNAIDSITAVL